MTESTGENWSLTGRPGAMLVRRPPGKRDPRRPYPMMTYLAAQWDTLSNIEIAEIDAASWDFSYPSSE